MSGAKCGRPRTGARIQRPAWLIVTLGNADTTGQRKRRNDLGSAAARTLGTVGMRRGLTRCSSGTMIRKRGLRENE